MLSPPLPSYAVTPVSTAADADDDYFNPLSLSFAAAGMGLGMGMDSGMGMKMGRCGVVADVQMVDGQHNYCEVGSTSSPV